MVTGMVTGRKNLKPGNFFLAVVKFQVKRIGGKMSYRDFYMKIVKKENEDKIITLLKENDCWERFQIKQLQVIEADPYAYILIDLDILGEFAAQYLGIFLDIRKHFPWYEQENFYLVAIACPADYHQSIKKYVNKDVSIAHELLHIRDIIMIIENDPGYLEKVFRYGFENIHDPADLEESIEFETGKTFKIEPQALENDFKNGENLIFAPFIFGMIMKYKCETKDEYIRLSMSNYIMDLQEMYIEKFEETQDKIKEYFKNSVNKHGRQIFGDNAYEKILELKKGSADRMLHYETSRMKRSTNSGTER